MKHRMKPAQRNLLNFIAFQLAWITCVLGGASGRVLAGMLVVAAAIGLHLVLSRHLNGGSR